MIALSMNNHPVKDRGFTLIELVVVLALIAILTAVTIPFILSAIQSSQRQNTEVRINQIQNALSEIYSDDAMAIDDDPKAEMRFSDTSKLKAGLTGVVGSKTVSQSGMEKIAEYAGTSPTQISYDGFGRPWRILVSGRKSKTWRGYKVYYHVIAFVSNNGGPVTNGNPVLHNATGLNNGKLNLAGGDVGFAFSGYPVEVKLYQKTLKRMSSIKTAYESFFHTRYLASTQRDIFLDYFANSCSSSQWDTGNPVGNSCNKNFRYPGANNPPFTVISGGRCDNMTPITKTSNGLAAAIGVGAHSALTAWGFPLAYGVGKNATCHSGVVSRNPDNSDNSMKSPPYTALITGFAPGGVSLVKVATGSY